MLRGSRLASHIQPAPGNGGSSCDTSEERSQRLTSQRLRPWPLAGLSACVAVPSTRKEPRAEPAILLCPLPQTQAELGSEVLDECRPHCLRPPLPLRRPSWKTLPRARTGVTWRASQGRAWAQGWLLVHEPSLSRPHRRSSWRPLSPAHILTSFTPAMIPALPLL